MSEQQTPGNEEPVTNGWSERTQQIVGVTTVLMMTVVAFGFGYTVCRLRNPN